MVNKTVLHILIPKSTQPFKSQELLIRTKYLKKSKLSYTEHRKKDKENSENYSILVNCSLKLGKN